ncbi:Protein MID1-COMPLEMENTING ACTIVITY 1 [Thelohanellus kitauei]|uniref:Protein MID1-COMPLEMENTING ACTIVITY 1 n=1 Tax=Thelohanellus kitauei TaxID=669202 RepID=A0A0C2MTS9_THEKT|nr:Protein MID1-COMPLEMENTING ACTIVITY 1 [Thelohanellus kitauei]
MFLIHQYTQNTSDDMLSIINTHHLYSCTRVQEQGIFGCCSNCESCLTSFFFPCIAAGRIAESMNDSCVLWGLLECCFPNCVAIVLRNKVRGNRNIDGNILGDFCCGFFCTCCVLSQSFTEMDAKICR